MFQPNKCILIGILIYNKRYTYCVLTNSRLAEFHSLNRVLFFLTFVNGNTIILPEEEGLVDFEVIP